MNMTYNELKPLVILVGPTAVGKTAASIGLAKALNGEIISGDSMQIFRGLDIGTAKITKEEIAQKVMFQEKYFKSEIIM